MAHTLDTYQVNNSLSANPSTFNYTCGAGTTVLVVSIVTVGTAARTGGAPTYPKGGTATALTQANSTRAVGSSYEANVEVWYLLEPDTGSALQVSIPNSGSNTLHVFTCSAKAASGFTSAYDTANGAENAASANPSAAVTTTVNGAFVFSRSCDGYKDMGTGNKTQFGDSVWGTDHGAYISLRMYELQATLGTTTHTFTVTSDDWGIVVVAFKEAAKSYTYSGAITMSLTPGATYSFIETWSYSGAITLALTPGSTYFHDFPAYSGAITVTLTPNSTYEREWAYSGAITVSLTPASTYEREWSVTGTVTVELVPNSAYVFEEGAFVYSGNITVSLTPASSYAQDFEWDDSVVTVQLIPGSIYAHDHPAYAGAITVSLLPNSSYVQGWAYSGDVTLSLTPGSSYVQDFPPYAGAILVSLVPNSEYSHLAGGQFEYAGNITLSLSPSAGIIVEWAYAGAVILSLIPGSESVQDWAYTGQVVLELIPEADYFVPVEFIYAGYVLLTLMVSAEVTVTELISIPYAGTFYRSDMATAQNVTEPPEGSTYNFLPENLK